MHNTTNTFHKTHGTPVARLAVNAHETPSARHDALMVTWKTTMPVTPSVWYVTALLFLIRSVS